MFKKLWTSLPQLSLFIVLLALLKTSLYYFNFNVPIKYYLRLSELGVLIADDIFITLTFVLVAYFITTFNDNVKQKDKTGETTAVSKVERKRTKMGIFIEKAMFYFVCAIFILALVCYPVYLIIKGQTFTERLQGISFLIVTFCFYIFGAKHEKLKKYLTADGMIIYLFAVVFILFFMWRIIGEIESTESGKYTGTKIITNDSTYTSTDSAFYIGQTTSYIFFYNKKDKHTTILPIAEVKKLELYVK